MTWQILEGDCRDVLSSLPERSVHTCVTSPPYFGLRDYGTGEWEGGDPACDHLGEPFRTSANINRNWDGRNDVKNAEKRQPFKDACGKCGARRVDRQIGLEPTPDEFVAALVAVFREVRRVLRDDGTVWLNLGDSYAGSWGAQSRPPGEASTLTRNGGTGPNPKMLSAAQIAAHPKGQTRTGSIPAGAEYKPKDLIGIPWMVAFALRADGWYLRSDIIWSKLNPMPESVTDRPTKAHEYVFLLSKGPRYFYDADAIREPQDTLGERHEGRSGYRDDHPSKNGGYAAMRRALHPAGRNKRSVWTVATQPYAGAHFATFPPKLIEPCVLAGAPERCCSVCGAPWVRVVANHGPDKPNDHDRHTAPGQTIHRGLAAAKMGSTWNRETLGFEPSCTHNASTGPGTVLDPFAGAGTTGLVALKHSRSFIGIELNPEYAEMARWRIRDDAPLLNTYSEIQEAAA